VSAVGDIILTFLRDAWMALVAALAIFAVLALLAQLLRAAASSVIGASLVVRDAIAAGAGIFLLVLFAFLGTPALVRAASVTVEDQCETIYLKSSGEVTEPEDSGNSWLDALTHFMYRQFNVGAGDACGPIAELGQLAAMLIGALAALRILKAVFSAVALASVGGSVSLSGTLVEAGEAVLGMAMVSVAVPIVTHFFVH
jgi:ABC-type transport system involved in multi-copper enzyme maturation permease subunit